jgi:3-hydroxyisobutyrate dehydrogenase
MDLLGPLGAGATWKLINNQLGAGQIAALAEALEVARKAGFKDEKISELILGGPAASPMVKLKLPRMLAHDFEPADFALNLMLKDARYAAALAQSLGAPAGVIEGAVKAFARADAKGLGAKDIAAVVG